jgi:prepilin-type N-terminal cleavage/methylation domain-containing protein
MTRSGFTLLELLLSMTILSLVVIGMADLFSFTARTWSGQASGSAAAGDLHDAADLLRVDLESAFPGRHLAHATFDGAAMSNEVARSLFARRMLLPFELDRRSGGGGARSFVHPDAEAPETFSQLAFVALRPGAGSLLPETFYPERHGPLADPALPSGARPTPSDACLVGYYVAYTADSPFPGDNARKSMKLYRHFRPGGTSLGQAQAGSTIRAASHAVNGDALPNLRFANRDLPFLFAFHAPSPDPALVDPVPSAPPWPAWGSSGSAGPGSAARANRDAWFNPSHPVHDQLPADLPVARHVVRFRVSPFKRLRDGANLRLLGAAELAQRLGLPDAEWPALVTPDLVEVELAVVDDATAAALANRQDWLTDWENAANPSPAARLIRRSVATHRFRVSLHALPPEES